MDYNYETFKYDATERQAKALKVRASHNRHQENRGNQDRRRR